MKVYQLLTCLTASPVLRTELHSPSQKHKIAKLQNILDMKYSKEHIYKTLFTLIWGLVLVDNDMQHVL